MAGSTDGDHRRMLEDVAIEASGGRHRRPPFFLLEY